VFKFVEATFGMGSTMPYRVVATIVLAATGVLLFAFLRRLVGDWLALLAAILVLFLGPAWQTLLLPVELQRVGSLAAGIGMLLALRRRDRFGDRLACALLTASVLFFSLGVSFILAAAVDVALRRGSWRRRAFIPAIPLGIYVLWYFTYGRAATGNVSLHNVVTAPVYTFKAVASALQALVGLWPTDALQPGHPTWGWAVLGVVVIAVAIQLRRSRVVGDQLWPVLAAAVSAWLLAGATYVPGREATESRFQYTSAVFVLMVLAELCPTVRLARLRLAIAVPLAGLVLAANVSTLARGRDFLRVQSELSRADLGALELARRSVDPGFTLNARIAGTPLLSVVDARSYLSAVDAFGSPADSPRELAAAPEVDREWADVVLGNALPITLVKTSAEGGAAGASCARLQSASDPGGAQLTIRSRRAIIEAAPVARAAVRLRRFATGSFPFRAGSAAGGTAAALTIPSDLARRPWHAQVRARRAVTVCQR
jgi:hypothetical protein